MRRKDLTEFTFDEELEQIEKERDLEFIRDTNDDDDLSGEPGSQNNEDDDDSQNGNNDDE